MKTYATPIVIALIVAALVTWIARNTYWEEVSVPSTLRGEALTNPFYAAQKFSNALGAKSEWRRSLGQLPTENTVVLLAHWHWDVIEERRKQLEDWVSAGGRLVLDRTLIGGEEHLAQWAGLHRSYDTPEEIETEDDEEEANEKTNATAGVAKVDPCVTLFPVDRDGSTRIPGREYSLCDLDRFSRLRSDRDVAWGLANDKGLQAARVRIGRGSVTALNFSRIGNLDFLEGDHARLFASAAQLHRGDRVIFISERERASLLSLIWRYGAPVVVLFLLALGALLWRGGVRFGPMAADAAPSRRSLAEQIRGTGQFTLRLGGGRALHAAAVRALSEAATRRLAGYERLSAADRVAAIAQATGLDSESLAQAINHAGVRRRSDLASTLALLETARRTILETHR